LTKKGKNPNRRGKSTHQIDDDDPVESDFADGLIKTLVSKSQRSTVLVVENSAAQTWVLSTLRRNKIIFDLVNTLKQAYELKRGLLNYKFVVIDTIQLDGNFAPLAQAIQRYNKAVSVIVTGCQRNEEFERLFLADTSICWVGAESKKSQRQLVDFILKF
jgi:hypothetical protein